MTHALVLVLALAAGAPEPEAPPAPDARAIEALIRGLGSDSWEVRNAAKAELERLGDAARPHLEAALDHPDLEVRRAAAALLGSRRASHRSVLARQLTDRSNNFSESKLRATVLERGAEVMPFLLDAVRRENARHPRYDYYTIRNAFLAMDALAEAKKIGPDRIPEILDLLDTENTNCRSLCRPILRRLAGPDLLPKLLERFRKDRAPLRRARLLELIYDENRAEGLKLVPDAMTHEVAAIRLSAARLLRFQSTPEQLPLLIRATADPDPEVRAAVVQGLQRYPTDRAARAAVRVALRDPDDVVRRYALYAVAQMHRVEPDPTLIPDVRTFLKESDPAVIQAAAQLLGSARDRDSVPLFLALLAREDTEFRQAVVLSVIQALGQIQDPSARQPLEEFVRDPEVKGNTRLKTARVYAVQALLRIAGEEAIPFLEETLAENRETFAAQILLMTLLEVPGTKRVEIFLSFLDHEDRIVLARAAQGLGQCGVSAVAPRLTALLDREDAYLRQSVLEALGALASEEAAPAVLTFLRTLIDPDGATHPRNAHHVRLAIEALATAGHAPAEKPLVRLVKARGRFTEVAAEALSFLGKDEARKAVRELYDERANTSLARPLAVALARLGERGPLEEIHRAEMNAVEDTAVDGRILAFAADSAARLGHAERALALARRRVERDENDRNARYDLACVLALAGDIDRALAALEDAANRGYRNPRQLLRDPDLRTVRARPEFRVLLARMQQR